nr:ribosomal protein S18-alanine N-acetyltransferase [Hydrogenivirga sp. 128-5-R1-1]
MDEAEILMIAVEKSMQGKGVGKFILNKFIKDMKKLCIKEIFLEVAEDNVKAINLYKSLGFNEFDVRKKYYKDDKNAILMKKSVS